MFNSQFSFVERTSPAQPAPSAVEEDSTPILVPERRRQVSVKAVRKADQAANEEPKAPEDPAYSGFRSVPGQEVGAGHVAVDVQQEPGRIDASLGGIIGQAFAESQLDLSNQDLLGANVGQRGSFGQLAESGRAAVADHGPVVDHSASSGLVAGDVQDRREATNPDIISSRALVGRREDIDANGRKIIQSESLLRGLIHDYVDLLISDNHKRSCIPQTIEFGPIGGRGWHEYNPEQPPPFQEYALVISPEPSPRDFPTSQFQQVLLLTTFDRSAVLSRVHETTGPCVGFFFWGGGK